MSKTVNYSRGEGGYTLTSEELTHLIGLRDELLTKTESASEEVRSELGAGQAIYSYLLELISFRVETNQGVPYGERYPNPGVDHSTFGWIEGALRVNAGDGFFADFIREYTKKQFEVRGGPQNSAEQLNQEASNKIALAVANDIIQHQGLLPGISGLGAADAGQAASTVFKEIPLAIGNEDFAPWAGALLFPFLHYDVLYRNLIIESEQVFANIEGLAEQNKQIKFIEGAYDLIASIEAARLASTLAASFSTGIGNWYEAIQSLLLPFDLDISHPDVISDTTLFFDQRYELSGVEGFDPGRDTVFSRFNEAFESLPPSGAATSYRVGTYGSDATLSPNIGVVTTRTVVNAGPGNDTVTGSSVIDLLDGDVGDDQVFGLANDDYLYGFAGNDTLIGGDGSDKLYGGEGNDSLFGSDAAGPDDNTIDVMNGGVGLDAYKVGRGDIVIDSDRSAAINFEGIAVGATYTKVNGNYYRNAALGLSLFVNGDAARIWLSDTEGSPGFSIENFLTNGAFNNGDFGITLADGEVVPPGNTINGTPGDDSVENPDGDPLVGTANADAINGLAGNDELRGEAGDDILDGGAGVDVLVGDLGNDKLFGGTDTDLDLLAGHAGSDVLESGGGVGILSGGDDNDSLVGDSANDLLAGGAGMDVLQGGAGDDLLLGDSTYLPNDRDASFTVTRGADPVFTVDLVEFSGSYTSTNDQGDALSGGAGNDVLDGHGGDDLLNGDADDDILQGNIGHDTLKGGTGNDILFADPDNSTAWNDELDGGDGNDQLRGGLGRDTLFGGSGNDELAGDNPNSSGFATGGDADALYGQDGNDTLGGGDGNDLLDGGAGIDELSGGAGNDQLRGGADADNLLGGTGNDNLSGDTGLDTLVGGDGDDSLDGGTEADELRGGSGDDRLFGNEGNDLLVDLAGKDALYGGAGNDQLQGGDDSDTVDGGDGNDSLFGEAGADSLRGGAGVDGLAGGEGNDFLDGGAGNDIAFGDAGDDTVVGGTGSDELQGGASNDLIDGGQDNDSLYGDAGADTLSGGLGNDLVQGGDDDDVLYGDSGGDTMTGGAGADVLKGNDGDDFLSGGSGNDQLDGGTGDSYLAGGDGNDDYLINVATGLVEIDDTSGNDRIIFNQNLGQLSLQFTKQDGALYASAGTLQLKINDWSEATDLQLVVGTNPPLTHADIEEGFSQPPQVAVALADQQANEDSAFTYQIPSGSFVDPDGTTLTYQATLASGAPLPSWLSFDATTRTFSGTPLNAHVAGLQVRVTVKDTDDLTVSDTFTLTVNNVNDAPVLVHPLSDRRATTDFTFAYRIYDAMFADVDPGDTLTFTATLENGAPLPAWLSFSPSSRTFSGVPHTADIGSFNVKVTAKDSANVAVTDSFVIAVTSSSEAAAVETISNSVDWTNFLGFANGPVGDINGDGNDDVYASAYNGNGEGYVAVHSYVVYGHHEGIATNVGVHLAGEDMDLVHVTGATFADGEDGTPYYAPAAGVRFSGPLTTQPYDIEDLDDSLPRLVSLGDINGDGLGDMALNLRGASSFGSSATVVGPYVILGSASDYGTPDVSVFNLGSRGFEITRTPPDEEFDTFNVKGVGDINGDGLDDFLVGDGVDSGVVLGDVSSNPFFRPSTLVLGSRAAFPNLFDLDTAGNRVVRLGDQNGYGIRTMDAKGDFDGDGRNDPVAIDTNNNAYVIVDTFDLLNVQTYSGTVSAGGPVFAAAERIYSADYMGDFNGDGIDDLLVITLQNIYRKSDDDPGIPGVSDEPANATFRLASKAHVVFGREDASGPIDLTSLNGSNGFVVDIPFRAIDSGGDVDGDGLADIVVVDEDLSAHIIFGQGSAPSAIHLNDLSGALGLHLDAGQVYSADIRSDLNGDGFSDIYLGAPTNGFQGESYVLYGTNFRQQVAFAGSAGNDYVEVDTSGTVLTGSGDDEVHVSGTGTLVIKTGTGNDQIFLKDKPTATVYGGPGDDDYFVDLGEPSPSVDVWKYHLADPSGNSTLRIRGNGKGVVVVDFARPDSNPGNSLAVGTGSSDNNFSLRPGSLHIAFDDVEYEIHLVNLDHNDVLGGPRDFDTFEFTDGVLTFEQLIAHGFDVEGTASADTLSGTNVVDRMTGLAGNDLLTAGAGDDTLDPGTGNDTVSGGDGNDLYHYAAGGGQDSLLDSAGNDTVMFGTGITVASLTAAVAGNDVVVSIAGGGQLTLKDWLLGASRQIENFRFTDSPQALLTAADINTMAGVQNVNTITGTAAANVLTGTGAPDLIDGLAGNDNIDGGAGNDVIIGGAGRDTLKGSTGDDTFKLSGSDAEYDSVNGGDGQDQLLGGEGDDTFRFHNFSGENTVERIDGAAGENLIAGTDGANLIDLSGTVVVNVARIEGLAGNDNITGSASDDFIVGGAGLDTLKGNAGNDTFVLSGTDTDYDSFSGGDGMDKLLGSAGADTFRFHNFTGANTVELIDGGAGDNVIAGTDGANAIDLSTTELVNILRIEGLGGNDNLTGSIGNDFIIGGPGRDTLKGQAGHDTFVHEGTDTEYDSVNGGEGLDELIGGVGDDTFRFHNFSGDNRVEVISGGAGTNIIAGTEGANVIDLSGIQLAAIARLEGLDGNDALTGNNANNLIIGGKGRDTVKGEGGNDTFLLSGTDTDYDSFNGGNGVDTLRGGDDDDTFRFHNFSGENTVEFLEGGAGFNVIEGTDGANLIDLSGTEVSGIEHIDGLADNDNITGSDSAELIIGGLGRDTMQGRGGDDTFFIRFSDTEYDSVNGGDGADKVLGSVYEDTFRFHNFSGANTVEVIDGVEGVDVIAGTDGANVLDLSATTLINIDRILGLGGNDNIKGSVGNDKIHGGGGNDVLNGGEGSDTFFFATGDGNDTIDNRTAIATDQDQLFLDAGLGDLHFSASSGDLLIKLLDTGDSIRIKGALLDPQHMLDGIYVGNEVLQADEADDLVAALAAIVPGGPNGTFTNAQRVEIVGIIEGFFDPVP
jgi:Ca2+-binding RTX toxin-like protein